MFKKYVPDRGDVVWIDFDPQAGHEQRGHRPALVISKKLYNKNTNLALFCPITSKEKGFSFEVPLPSDAMITGVVLSDQVKNLDWKARKAEYVFSLPEDVMNEILIRVRALLD
jgi:mRNA interferase MazF